MGRRRKGWTGPRSGCLNVSWYACGERNKKFTHRSGGRLEDLRFAACVTADMTDSSISCAAQMEEIDSSKEPGSWTSAGTRLFKSSTVRVGLELEVGRVDVDSGSSEKDSLRDGVLNLTTGFVYGRGRLSDKALRTRNRCWGGNSLISVQVSNPDNQAPVLLNAVAAKRKPPASNKLNKIGSVAVGIRLVE